MRIDKADIDREVCQRSLSGFVRKAWKVLEPEHPYVYGWHIAAVCEHLEAVTNGEITRLLINIPPGTAKSMMTAVFWPAWEWGPKGNESMRFIGASYSQDNALRDNLKMRRLIESDWYQELWPVKLTHDQNQKTYFENEKTGWRQACPVGSMTGKRGDRVLWDDPHSVEDAYSKPALKEATRIFKETLPTRLNNPKSSAIVVVMQRLAEQDVSGLILANDYGYEHLMLPMEYEAKRCCVTSIGFSDPREEEGELLFPERFPVDVVDRDKKIMGALASAGQLQQRPAPLGGNLVKGEWFGRYKVLPKLQYRNIYADTASKTKERNDYSVFGCYGLTDDGHVCVIDLLRGKWEAPELKRKAVDFWKKHKADNAPERGPLQYLKVEDASSGTGLIQNIKSEASAPIQGIPRVKDKLTRLMGVVGYIESGYVDLPEDSAFASDFVAECEAFTADDSHAFDDQLDTLMDALEDMKLGLKASTGMLEFYRQEAERMREERKAR